MDQRTSVVTTTYGAQVVYGGMGVLGPTRMDYPGAIANVAAVATYIGEVLRVVHAGGDNTPMPPYTSLALGWW